MLHLIPKPLHRLALRLAHRLRHHWRKASGRTGAGVSVIARDLGGQILLVLALILLALIGVRFRFKHGEQVTLLVRG